ncbi:VOC family protein [Halopiger djelfimassiliensis]|uniref:VOC family protein n=1 Tax=Halopiger djelfimassiliensis TaxID=1293047 RepID=UPI000677FDAB|nr:VOC family protein [Halopiger djelfimassiliensis]
MGRVDGRTGRLHHLELYTTEFDRSKRFWGWLLPELGYEPYQEWDGGTSWKRGETYLVLAHADASDGVPFDRRRPGLNHVAFHAASRDHVDEMTRKFRERGVPILYEDQHPYAGGDDHYAVYAEDPDGIKVELVAPQA